MWKLERVVVPVDVSAPSAAALAQGQALARWCGASLTALHVHVPLPSIDPMPAFAGQAISLVADDPQAVRDTVHRFVQEDAVGDVAAAEVVIESTDVRRTILEYARDEAADLIVMGTHGRTGVNHMLLGSVTERVLRQAGCPVLVVPPDAHAAPMWPARRILCPVDFSSWSRDALRLALDIAQEGDATLTVLHALEMPPELHASDALAGFDVSAIREATRQESLRRLDRLVPPEVLDYCHIDFEIVEGRAHREIVRLARERQSDVIVMGVHGRNAIDRLMFGTNTHAVITHAGCPVLAVRPQTREQRS